MIDPKALSKEALYGSLDPTTLEWTDGVFTARSSRKTFPPDTHSRESIMNAHRCMSHTQL